MKEELIQINKEKKENKNENENKKYWVWFTLIEGLGIKRKEILLDKYKEPKNIYNKTKEELMKIEGIGEKIAENIVSIETKNKIEKHIRYIEENNIDIVTIKDKEYPEGLKNIYDPPIVLYVKGNKEILNNKQTKIAIVGCRKATEYGLKTARYFAYNLANKKDIIIVSGLAKGIDSISHIGSIEAKGKTIAVIGNGLDSVYPKENSKLYEEIIKNEGTIITEYPLGTKPNKMNFPARNRIISGLSKGIIVVEAKEKSGTLITVDFALEQGREVYVIPGNINSKNSVGTNRLIKEGAKVVTSFEDIIE